MEIKYIKQPTGYLCGQSCVAMLANVTVDEVIELMNNDKGTSKKEIADTLNQYGIKHAKTMIKANNSTPLPDVCILKLLLPGYSHWALYYKGTYYDPEFGVLESCYSKARIQYYFEIYLEE
jgi:hypothetical protein